MGERSCGVVFRTEGFREGISMAKTGIATRAANTRPKACVVSYPHPFLVELAPYANERGRQRKAKFRLRTTLETFAAWNPPPGAAFKSVDAEFAEEKQEGSQRKQNNNRSRSGVRPINDWSLPFRFDLSPSPLAGDFADPAKGLNLGREAK